MRSSFSVLLAPGFLLMVVAGCVAPTLAEVDEAGAIEVVLDANTRDYAPNVKRPLKFYVDVHNRSGHPVSLAGFKVELRASPRAMPERVQLRQSWTYRYSQSVTIDDGRKLTIPIVPERGDAKGDPSGVGAEFPVELLAAGDYGIVALVNGRHLSKPYRLRVVRPDLEMPARSRMAAKPGAGTRKQ